MTYIDIPQDSDFTIYNIPFGVGIIEDAHTVVSRIGDYIIDLNKVVELRLATLSDPAVLRSQSLNRYIALGKSETVPFREAIIALLKDASVQEKMESCLVPANLVQMVLPIEIQDYTDFYSSREHATNVGTMFRGKENALMPNWLYLPVGYHGRAGSIIVSGQDIRRPAGQTCPVKGEPPVFGPSKLVDFELEMGMVIGGKTEMGTSVSTAEAEDYIFGLTIFNDWSARDIQGWEYVPLGPFLAKSFASTLSPWIITLEAMEPFRVAGPKQEPEVFEYLQYEGQRNFDIQLFVDIETPSGHRKQVCASNYKYLYWNMSQQLAHQTVAGCNINVGDFYATGTISGPDKDSYGSMLELTWRGANPIDLGNGETRKFIHDGDTVYLRGKCVKGDISIGFGECKATILPH